LGDRIEATILRLPGCFRGITARRRGRSGSAWRSDGLLSVVLHDQYLLTKVRAILRNPRKGGALAPPWKDRLASGL